VWGDICMFRMVRRGKRVFWYGGAERVGYLTGSAYEGFASWGGFFLCVYQEDDKVFTGIAHAIAVT
jgi:hypothetical protein